MWTIFVTAFAGFLACGSTIFVSEYGRLWLAWRAIENGRAFEGFTSCHRLATSEPLFLTERQLELCQETAAHAAVDEAIRAHNFRRALLLVRTISSGIESGFEADAVRWADTMPETHLRWTSELIDKGELRSAIKEALAIGELYPDNAPARTRARQFETSARLQLIRQVLANGDLQGAVDLMSSLDPELPLPAQADGEALLREALTRAAETYANVRDYPALYRFFGKSRALVGHLMLRTTVDDVFADVTQRLFEIPFRPRGVLAVKEPPLPVAVGTAGLPDGALLLVHNNTGQPLTVVLRGQEHYRATLPPGARREFKLEPGEYVQAAYGAPDVRPYVGVIGITGQSVQAFTIAKSSDDPPVPDGRRSI